MLINPAAFCQFSSNGIFLRLMKMGLDFKAEVCIIIYALQRKEHSGFV